MTVLKQYNTGTSTWETVVVGQPGEAGIVNGTVAPADTSVLWLDTADAASQVAIPSGGTAGQVLAKTSGTDYATGWIDNPGSRNVIINGAFEINQRNFSTSTSAGYGVDRWYNQTDTTGSGTATYSLQTFTPGSAPSAGYEAANFLRCVTSGQSAAGVYTLFQQSIESVRTFAGQTVTVSFWAKAASGAPKIAVLLSQDFGTGGSPSSSVETNTGKVTLSTSWTRYSITANLPSLTGKTIGTNANTSALTLLLWLSAGSNYDARSGSLGVQNNTFDIWGVQVEAGSAATPFKRAGGTIQGELAACERYYWRYAPGIQYKIVSQMGISQGSTQFVTVVNFPVTMRTAPTSIEGSGLYVWQRDYNVGDVDAVISSVQLGYGANNLCELIANASSLSNKATGFIRTAATNGYIGFSAEF